MTNLVLIGLGLNDASPVPKDDADDDQIGIDSLDEIHDSNYYHFHFFNKPRIKYFLFKRQE